MKLKSFFKFIIYSDSWVSLCFFSLSFGIGDYLNVENNLQKALFSFFATLLAYQFHRSKRLKNQVDAKNDRLIWLKNHSFLRKLIALISLLSLVFTFFYLKITLFNGFILFLNGLLVILYTNPTEKWNGLRSVPYLKSVFIGISWATFCCLNANDLTIELVLICCLIFYSVQLQIIPFDLRDITFDSPTMKTVPQVFGKYIKNAYFFGSFLFISCTYFLFEWNNLLVVYLISSILGFVLPKKYTLLNEFLWEFPLMILGFYFLFR